MKFPLFRPPHRLLLALVVAGLGAPSGAQHMAQRQPTTVFPETPHGAEADLPDLSLLAPGLFEQVLHDSPGPGEHWAAGRAYKARFHPGGVEVHPFLGSEAPRNFPVSFELTELVVDGHALPLPPGEVRRQGDRLVLDRGLVSEVWDLSLDSLEQTFVLQEPPTGSDLTLRLAVHTDLVSGLRGGEPVFANELGGLSYGEAFVVGAGGQRVPVERRFTGAGIEIEVPAAAIGTAGQPLVVDPLITFFTAAATVYDEFWPDVAYDAGNDRWCVVHNRAFSATDYDVLTTMISGSGTILGTSIIDLTGEHWVEPAIANNRVTGKFLVAASRTITLATWDIVGRTVDAGTLGVSGITTISPTGGTRRVPDVGGDPYPGQSYFCVVWQSDVSVTNSNIEYRLVDPGNFTIGNTQYLETSFWKCERPSISPSLGQDGGSQPAVWTIVWQLEWNSADHDIHGAQIYWDGTVWRPNFTIDVSTWDDKRPSVSTVVDVPVVAGSERDYLVVYERNYGSDHDLRAALMRGNVVSSTSNLVTDFPEWAFYRDQRSPSVDCDGRQFLVAFDERDVPGGPNPDVFVGTYFPTPGGLVPCEVHRYAAGSIQVEGDVSVASAGATGGPKDRFMPSWVYESLNAGYDVQVGLWAGCNDGLVTGFCSPSPASGECPCGNAGAPGHGCGNSQFSQGGFLDTTGSASLTGPGLVLRATRLPLGTPCLFFQSIGSIAPVPFGDGVYCAGTGVVRFPVQFAGGGTATFPGPSDPSIPTYSQLAGLPILVGSQRYYQAWYRDPGAYCTSATFNLTNALSVVWAP